MSYAELSVAEMSPEEIANLMRESARGGAQDAITQLEARNQLNAKAYLSIDSPATVLSLLAAFCASMLYIVGAETGPLEGQIKVNAEDIKGNSVSVERVRVETLERLDEIGKFIMQKK